MVVKMNKLAPFGHYKCKRQRPVAQIHLGGLGKRYEFSQ